MSKKKKIIIYSVIGLILLSAIIFILCCHFLIEKDSVFNGFNFKEVTEVNYGSFDLSNFIEGVTCDESCFYNNDELEYSITNIEELGKIEVLVQVTYEGVTYEHTYNLNVIDTIAPTITLSSPEIEIASDSKFDATSYIIEVSDNYDELTIDNVEIENNVDTEELGDYEVIYTLTDSNNNTSSVTLIVHVVDLLSDKETEEKETNKENNTTTNSNKNNTTSKNQTSNNTSSAGFKSAINSVSLSPLTTRHVDLDNEIASIISSVTNSGMSNYEKLQAIYNYVKNKLSYEMMVLNLNELWEMQDTYGYYSFDGMEVMRAIYSLRTGKGVCDNYAALFMILARRIGFDAYVVGGKVNKVGGGTTGHAQVMIKAGGTYYIFDPQIEDSKGTSYDYFGKTDAELPIYHYTLSTHINSFHFFKENPNLGHSFSLDVKVSGDYTDTLSDGSIHTRQFSIDLGSSISIELTPSRTQKYTIKVTSNENVILNESYDGSSPKIINYTFENPGTDKVTIIVKVDGYEVEYNLLANVKEIENSNP